MPQRALCIYASVLSIGVYICFSCKELCIMLVRVFLSPAKKKVRDNVRTQTGNHLVKTMEGSFVRSKRANQYQL